MTRDEMLEDLQDLLELMQKNNVNLKDQAENIFFMIQEYTTKNRCIHGVLRTDNCWTCDPNIPL